MKTIGANLQSHLEQTTTTLSMCWKLTATDGTVKAFTSHTQDISFESVTYSAALGYTPSAVTTNISLAVSNMEVEGILSLSGFDYDDVLYGKWNNAEVKVFLVNWGDTSQGEVKLRKGWIGEIELGEHGFTGEIRGLTQAISQNIVGLYGPGCPADLGDDRCKVRLDPPVWEASTPYAERSSFAAETGSVVKPTVENARHFKCTTAGTSGASEPTWNTTIDGTTVDGTATWTTIQALTVSGTITSATNDRVFFDTSRLEADGFFDQGKITFTSGLNIGRSMEVKSYLNTGGQIDLVIPMVEAVQVGDAYTLHAGCSKDFQTACKTKFDNTINFRAFPHVPQTGTHSIVNT